MHTHKPLQVLHDQNKDEYTLSPPVPSSHHLAPKGTAFERPILGSPIHLSEPSSVLLPPPPPTISSQGRPKFIPTRPQSPSLRLRAITRECRETPQPHAFDDLPWIASLETSPDITQATTSSNPWDIADLSLLPVPPLSELPASGVGPVRRRKTSLRYSPLASSKSTSHLPIRDSLLPVPSQAPDLPTPRSRFTPSRVLFQNLMPVTCDSSMYRCFTN